MRIVLADYSGHAFPAELSRELARRGHQVLHLYFAEFQSPKGPLSVHQGDPVGLAIEPISLGRPFAKHNLIRRRGQEIEIGRRFAARVARFGPDAVIGCNMPLDTISQIQRESIGARRTFIFWQQDIYSVAIEKILGRKFGLVGRLIGGHYRSMERKILRDSDAVVVISKDFVEHLQRDFGIDSSKVHVVENWAPSNDITPRPKNNPWSKAHGLFDKAVVLYTGTLGMKHDPALILAVAGSFRDCEDVRIVIASEGPGADWLRRQAEMRGLRHLKVLGFQSFSDYPDLLATADVLVAILESDAGAFCVPSKVLSYLCAARPVVMSGPRNNLSARILEQSRGGIIVDSGDGAGLTAAVRMLLDSPGLREAAGRGGRAYAEAHFSVVDKANRFEAILASRREA